MYAIRSYYDPKPWTLLATISSQSTNYYLDQGLSLNDEYSYYVVTVDTSGNYSNRSSDVTGTADGLAALAGEDEGGCHMRAFRNNFV